MYSYDEILASGYYVFRENLSTWLISIGVKVLKDHNKLATLPLKITELNRIIEFKEQKFILNSNYRMEDITPFVKDELVLLFQGIQACINEYYGKDSFVKRKG